MKKILSILFLLCAILSAQQTFNDTTSAGANARKYVSTYSDDTHAPFPVQIIPRSGTGTTSTTYSRVDTAATTSDSIATTFYIQYLDVFNTGSQIVYLCVDTSFGDNKVPLPAGASYRWAVKTKKIHYKSVSGTSIIYLVAQ